MADVNIETQAYHLALNHVRAAIQAGKTEGELRADIRATVTDAGDVKVGGIVKGRYHADKVIVRRVGTVRCYKAFDLHKLYLACNPGQASIFDIIPDETS